MSKIKPMQLIASMSGKICGHSNTYFAVRNGTQYTGTICNPFTGEPTEKQTTVRCIFADTVAAIKALSEEQRAEYEAAFKRQKKYKTLRGYIFAQLYKNNENL